MSQPGVESLNLYESFLDMLSAEGIRHDMWAYRVVVFGSDHPTGGSVRYASVPHLLEPGDVQMGPERFSIRPLTVRQWAENFAAIFNDPEFLTQVQRLVVDPRRG